MSLVISPLAVSAAAVGLIAGYALLGGTHGPALGTLTGEAAITEQRFGMFGLQWSLPRSNSTHVANPVNSGDTIVASTPITITFNDGSQSVAEAGSRFVLRENGIALQSGAIDSRIAKRAPDQRFVIESDSGSVTVKGTEFRVEIGAAANMTVTTFEGVVSARNDVSEIDITTGELAQLQRGAKPMTKLQVPRLSLLTRDQKTLVTNVPSIEFNARIVPNGKLIAIDASGREYARFVADMYGNIATQIKLQAPGRLKLRFIQEDASGSRRSDVSDQLESEFDPAAFTLRVTQAKRTGNAVVVMGAASPDSKVTIQGAPVTVSAAGMFSHTIGLAAGQSEIEIISIDPAGNATRLIQVLDQ